MKEPTLAEVQAWGEDALSVDKGIQTRAVRHLTHAIYDLLEELHREKSHAEMYRAPDLSLYGRLK